MMIFHYSLDVILYSSLGLLVHLVTHKLKARRKSSWKHKLERNCVVTWVKLWNRKSKARLAVVHDYTLLATLNRDVFPTSRLDLSRFLIHPAYLLGSFNLDDNMSGGSVMRYSKINGSIHSSTGIIYLLTCLNNHVS
jgi:hypothetical protein